MGKPGGSEEAAAMTTMALKLGYRHVDTVRNALGI
jgi:diketogulonate reductase-like aldo/keto reductase